MTKEESTIPTVRQKFKATTLKLNLSGYRYASVCVTGTKTVLGGATNVASSDQLGEDIAFMLKLLSFHRVPDKNKYHTNRYF